MEQGNKRMTLAELKVKWCGELVVLRDGGFPGVAVTQRFLADLDNLDAAAPSFVDYIKHRPTPTDAVTTYTPTFWASLTDAERYNEYVRVRRALIDDVERDDRLVTKIKRCIRDAALIESA